MDIAYDYDTCPNRLRYWIYKYWMITACTLTIIIFVVICGYHAHSTNKNKIHSYMHANDMSVVYGLNDYYSINNLNDKTVNIHKSISSKICRLRSQNEYPLRIGKNRH